MPHWIGSPHKYYAILDQRDRIYTSEAEFWTNETEFRSDDTRFLTLTSVNVNQSAIY